MSNPFSDLEKELQEMDLGDFFDIPEGMHAAGERKPEEEDIPNPSGRSIRVNLDRMVARRANSEKHLDEILEWDLQPGYCYHIISGGDVDSLTFLRHILRNQPVDYLLLSTWCMAMQDCVEIERFLQIGRIKRLDSYVGEIFKNSYFNEWLRLIDMHKKYGGRVAMFRNHSKVMCGFGEKYDFVIDSSANVNTNPRTENTVITTTTELALFYKKFFDDIRSFDRQFDEWQPTQIQRK